MNKIFKVVREGAYRYIYSKNIFKIEFFIYFDSRLKLYLEWRWFQNSPETYDKW